MVNQMNMDLIATILILISGIIYLDRMEWALGELRGRIHQWKTQPWYLPYFNLFNDETKAWILHICTAYLRLD